MLAGRCYDIGNIGQESLVKSFDIRGHQKSILSQEVEFCCFSGGGGGNNNPLSMSEWDVTMLSIMFCKFQHWMMSNRERNSLRRSSLCSQLKVYADLNKGIVRLVSTKFL